jgi:hypothetical protein
MRFPDEGAYQRTQLGSAEVNQKTPGSGINSSLE